MALHENRLIFKSQADVATALTKETVPEEEIQVSNQRDMVSNIHCLIVSIKLPLVLIVLRSK